VKKILFLFLITSISGIYAQILKDTTLPYGVFSTKYYYESDDKYFNNKRRDIDTTFMKYQNYEGALTSRNFYQNLGVAGSTSKAVFYEVNREIGLSSGYDAFSQYYHPSEKLIYYDTRSPFSQLNYVQGSTGESRLKVNLAAPISKKLGLGLDVGRYTSRKIAGRTGDKTADRLTSSYYLGLYLNYKSANGRYKIFGNSTLDWNTQNENGGFNLSQFRDKENLFDSLDFATINLFNASSFTNYYRNEVKVYQNYRISQDSLLGFFHEFGFQRCTTNIFIRPGVDSLGEKYFGTRSFYDPKNSSYSYRFDRLENKAGLAGKHKNIDYVLFFKNRLIGSNLLATSKLVEDDTSYRTRVSENYIGADLRLKFLNEKLWLGLYAEQKLLNSVSGYQHTNFNNSLLKDGVLDVYVGAPFIKVGYLYKETSPTVFQTNISHNNYRWTNVFPHGVQSSNLYLEFEKRIRKQYFAVNLYKTTLDHYIYFDSTKSVTQASDSIELLRASITTNFTLWKFHLDNQLEIAKTNNDTIFPVPSFVVSPKIYFGSKYKTLNFNIGLEALYVSGFYAYNYNPELNSFSTQRSYQTYGKPVVTPFVNGQIQNFSFWLKYSFVNQSIEKGYFTTPSYMGLPQTFSFGVNWLLYE
jgi:hypothetical protein